MIMRGKVRGHVCQEMKQYMTSGGGAMSETFRGGVTIA